MWGPEESLGYFPFTPGQAFEIILLCEPTHFKVLVLSFNLSLTVIHFSFYNLNSIILSYFFVSSDCCKWCTLH